MTYTIYGLRLRGSTEVRYIGFTSHTPQSRLTRLDLEARLYGRRPTEGMGGWLFNNKGEIEAVELATVATKAEAHAAERAAVLFCLKLNHRLFNTWLVPADQRLKPSRRTPYAPADQGLAA
jgi:hypothetical protein